MNLAQILQKRPLPEVTHSSLFKTTDHIGLEIEVQGGESRDIHRLSHWNVVPEGSVRGFELVLNQPKAGEDLLHAIIEAEEGMNQYMEQGSRSFEQVFPEMTSVHCHINILDMTVDQLISFLTLSIMFESILYNYVESHRNKNHFCLATLDAQDIITRIKDFVREYRRTGDSNVRRVLSGLFTQSRTKYAGINLSSIAQYGSLEFRMHQGTHQSNDLIRWVNIIQTIKAYAMGEDRTPSNILETKQEIGITTLFQQVLGDYSMHLETDGLEQEILDGIRQAQDFVAAYNEPPRFNPIVAIPDGDSSLYDNYHGSTRVDHDEDYEDEDEDDS